MGNGTSRPVVPGLVLIVLGVLFLLSNFGAFDLDWETLWTWVIILLGAIFWIGFLLDRSKDGLIMPGTILLVVGIVFNVSARSDWGMMEDLWPFFILAPALGFYLMYLLGKRDRGVLVPAIILTIIGLVFLMGTSSILRWLGPLIMIGIGALILVARGKGDGGGHNIGGGRAGGSDAGHDAGRREEE